MTTSSARVAALYDIHGNLAALRAVLRDVHLAGVDHIVVGGDVVPGPMPRETLAALMNVNVTVQFLYGNGDRAVLAERAATDDPATVTYWGTTSGEPQPEARRRVVRWTAQQACIRPARDEVNRPAASDAANTSRGTPGKERTGTPRAHLARARTSTRHSR